MTSRRRTMPNQRYNNVVYVSVEIYIVLQRWNMVVYFNVELNNVKQCQNNVVIFNVDFSQRWTTSKRRCEYNHLKNKLSLDSKTK